MFKSILRTLAPLAVLAITGCAAAPSNDKSGEAQEPVRAPSVGSPGSHVGGHGMNLFGNEKFYLSHIPTFGNPHNIQVVVEAKIVSGVPEGTTFGAKNFTVSPSRPFSLYDFAAGTLPAVQGTIFDGNFESGGRPIFRNVTFQVVKVVYQHGLLPSTPRSETLDYIAVGTPTDPYLVHVIDDPHSFDQIVGVKFGESAPQSDALSEGTFVSINGGVNTVTTRLAANAIVNAILPAAQESEKEGPGGETVAPAPGIALQVRAEVACLPGPDFYGTCRPVVASSTP